MRRERHRQLSYLPGQVHEHLESSSLGGAVTRVCLLRLLLGSELLRRCCYGCCRCRGVKYGEKFTFLAPDFEIEDS